MQNLIILLLLSVIQTMSISFLTASIIVVLFRAQNYHSTSKAATIIIVVSTLCLAISTALILQIDFENIKLWMYALSVLDLLSFLSGLSIGVQNVKKL